MQIIINNKPIIVENAKWIIEPVFIVEEFIIKRVCNIDYLHITFKGENKKMKRISYKERLNALYCCKKITQEEYAEMLLKHEEKLEKNRKYKKGELITSLDMLMQQEFIYIYHKIWNKDCFRNLQIGFLKVILDKKQCYTAIKKGE